MKKELIAFAVKAVIVTVAITWVLGAVSETILR